jgi:pimeloyl-ACP methyl ester carboxylesterase
MTVSHQSIVIEGRHAQYWIGGSGLPLVLLHGSLGDARQHWQPTFAALAAQFQIVAPDLPGFGVSDQLGMPSYQAYLSWLHYLFELLNIGGPIVLMGHSFGGTLGRLYAAENISYVTRLVLVDGGQVTDTPGCMRALFRLPVFNSVMFALLQRAMFSVGNLRRAVHDEQLLTSDFINTARGAAAGFVAALKQIGLINAPALRTPTCPTLVVWGEHDRMISPLAGQKIVSEIPGARFELIQGAAHLPQIEQPQAFHATVSPFLTIR